MSGATFDKALFTMVSATLFACGDPLVSPELIVNTRVLAARIEAAGDANRAWVQPSEAASIRWFVASPTGAAPLGWGFSACVAESVSRGLPICAAPPFAQATSAGVSTSEPRFDVIMPDAASLVGAPQIAVQAAFCATGVPTTSGVDFTATTCPDASEEPLFATATVFAALDGSMNANPDFTRVSLLFDGVDWPTWSDEQASFTSCADPGLAIPHVAAGSGNHDIRLSVPADMSEPVHQVTVHSAARETLSLAHFVTSGDLERAYSDVNVLSDPALVNVHWGAPKTIGTSGELVRFYFVLRDGRGGTDYTLRTVCVTP